MTALDITTNVGTIDDLTSTARIVLVLPVAILDAVFILWVFTSLSKTLGQLQARRAGAKLDLYRYALWLGSTEEMPLFCNLSRKACTKLVNSRGG